MGVASLAAGLLLAHRLARQLTSAMNRLSESASRIAQGLPAQAGSMPFRETEAFDSALAQMAVLVQQRTLERDRAAAAAERVQRERERLEFLAGHDALTGLVNRRRFDSLLDERMTACRQERGQLAVLYVDVDGFKRINDRLGHSVGDELLCCFAARLRAGVRASDVVARLGGDEFALILEHTGIEQAVRTADALIEQLARPYHVRDMMLEVSASIGIAVNPDASTCARTLVEAADAAMYRAKGAGKAQYATSDFGLLRA
jgi:diguanylate cyclase (GGDEF)-like protein